MDSKSKENRYCLKYDFRYSYDRNINLIEKMQFLYKKQKCKNVDYDGTDKNEKFALTSWSCPFLELLSIYHYPRSVRYRLQAIFIIIFAKSLYFVHKCK